MSHPSVYIITAAKLKTLNSKGFVYCPFCDKPLDVGDVIESKNRSRGKKKLVHKKCLDDRRI